MNAQSTSQMTVKRPIEHTIVYNKRIVVFIFAFFFGGWNMCWRYTLMVNLVAKINNFFFFFLFFSLYGTENNERETKLKFHCDFCLLMTWPKDY